MIRPLRCAHLAIVVTLTVAVPAAFVGALITRPAFVETPSPVPPAAARGGRRPSIDPARAPRPGGSFASPRPAGLTPARPAGTTRHSGRSPAGGAAPDGASR